MNSKFLNFYKENLIFIHFLNYKSNHFIQKKIDHLYLLFLYFYLYQILLFSINIFINSILLQVEYTYSRCCCNEKGKEIDKRSHPAKECGNCILGWRCIGVGGV